MKILISVSSLRSRELTGIGIYVKNLIDNLRSNPEIRIDGSLYAEKYHDKNLVTAHISIPIHPYVHFISGLNAGRYDIYHGPDFKIPFSRMYRKVVTVHDLVDYESTIVDREKSERGTHKLEHMLLSDRPDSIITISEFTRDKLLQRFPQFESITTAVHLAVDHIPEYGATKTNKRTILDPYILSVSTVEKRKNLITAIKAFELIKTKYPSLHYIIVGKNGYRHEETDEYIKRSPYAPFIHRKGFISNEELLDLYCNAELFLLPSLYEGFGIPILEAMRLRCPVITSNQGAMKEISGNAALLINPLSVGEIAEGMKELFENSSKRSELVEAGQKRSSFFTWKRCTEQTLEVYKRIAGTGH
jgi:O-antigen biosynthesis alpha-1,3-mannosyltransferase